MHTFEMSVDRRRLLVLALGAACWAVASSLNQWLRTRGSEGGWFNYAPNNAVSVSTSSGWIVRELVVWLLATIVWFAISVWLLERPKQN